MITQLASRFRRGNAIGIYGLMGSGKTILASALAYTLAARLGLPVVANVDYVLPHKRLRFFSELNTITDSIVVFDEAGINLNSRKFAAAGNLAITESLLLWRKRNCVVLFTAQQPRLVDVRLIENASHHMFCEAVPDTHYSRLTLIQVNLMDAHAVFSGVAWNRSGWYGIYDSYSMDVKLILDIDSDGNKIDPTSPVEGRTGLKKTH